MSQLKYFLRKNNNWALVPVSVACGLIESGGIIEKKKAFAVPRRTITCAFAPGNSKEKVRDSFIESLKETLLKMDSEKIDIFM